MSELIFNNLIVLFIGIAGIMALMLLWALPAKAPPSSRGVRRAHADDSLPRRLLEAAISLNPPSDVTMREHLRSRIVGEGGQVRVEREVELVLMIISATVIGFGSLIYSFATRQIPTEAVPFIVLFGLFLPKLLINSHNSKRRKRVVADLPKACQRLQLIVNATGSVPSAFGTVADMGEGPLYDEFRRAGELMAITPWPTVLRELDVRNDLALFSGLASELETASRIDEKLLPKIFQRLTEDMVNERADMLEARYGQISQKMSLVMTPFLLIALLIASIGPSVVRIIANE